jgi:hypothetical protein
MRLRLDEARERLVLTFPRRMSRRTVLDWALGQGEWVDRQLAHIQPGEPFVSGSTIPLEGRAIKLQWLESLPRNPALVDDVLRCGGPEAAFAAGSSAICAALPGTDSARPPRQWPRPGSASGQLRSATRRAVGAAVLGQRRSATIGG